MPESMTPLIILGVVGALFILLLSLLTNNYSLNNIKSKTVGDGQYGTARWATDQEIRKAYVTVPFDVAAWRAGKKRPTVQGLVLGSVQRGKRLEALVDRDDVHCLMIGASGVGKTAFFLYPNIEFACACGMSFLILDIAARNGQALHSGRIPKRQLPIHGLWLYLAYPGRTGGRCLCQSAGTGARHFDPTLRVGTGRRRDRQSCGNVPQRRPAAPHQGPERIAETIGG